MEVYCGAETLAASPAASLHHALQAKGTYRKTYRCIHELNMI